MSLSASEKPWTPEPREVWWLATFNAHSHTWMLGETATVHQLHGEGSLTFAHLNLCPFPVINWNPE